ncbi:tetratricopeptide repeat protein [Streptomyces sp. NA04227]|uniref:FxSxx-COOH system tetratricopeptide repeat protein n=1 Tax=Streptomyces sp. NA04227 TaxID=2742136 RepID=UPI001591C215|nr:FxSxx-COOH system tetratricopeptide repeat protein [Streptomyces sp. NA04227]QKW09118.1 tetratricopeptide repeat protein [Streptomyces sp. NA04227]
MGRDSEGRSQEERAHQERAHITVVFAGQSESWAHWIAHQIRAAGGATALIRWNPLDRPHTGDALADLLRAPGKVLVVVDDWHERLGSERSRAWAAVLREAMDRYGTRLAAVSIAAQALPPAVTALGPVQLRGLDPQAARRRVLHCLGLGGRPAEVDLSRGPRFPDDHPDVWNTQRRNHRFTGRTHLLESVHDTFAQLRADGGTVVLHGPGGYGKTQLALEYVHRFKGEYDIVWWVTAANRRTAREQFAALAGHLGVDASGQLDTVIHAVRAELADTARPWLLVLDGATTPDKLGDLVPDGRGHVLITSLHAEWAAYGKPLPVGAFERHESVAFVGRRTARLSEDEADQLAAAVEDVPLLLDQMSAWLDITPTASVPDYVRDIRRGKPDGFGVLESADYPESFQVAWAKTLNTLRDDAADAWHLLNLLACFSPELVPVRLLQSARPSDLPPTLRELVAEPSDWNTALRKLSEVTSMRLEYEPGRLGIERVSTLRMHRLFHRYVVGIQSPKDRERHSAAARQVLVAADPREPGQAGNWARYAELIPHLEPSGALASTDEDVRELVLNCVEYLRMRGEYHDGWWLSRMAVESWSATSRPTDRSVLVAVHQQANMLRRLGRHTDAEFVGRQTLDRLRETPGVRPIELIRAKDGLGGTLMTLGKYEEARALFEDAARGAGVELGDTTVPRTLNIRSNLAVALGLLGRYRDSLALHEEIHDAREQLLGPKHPTTLYSAMAKAWTLRLLGAYEPALRNQEHNSRLHSQILDRTHSKTLWAEHNLALCARRMGDVHFARAMMGKVREKSLKRRGGQHPDSLMVSCDYAMLLRELGQAEQARELAESTATLYAALQGEDHPYTIGARDNVTLLLRDAGDLDAALELSRRNRDRMNTAVGRDHPWALGCAHNGVAALARAGQRDEALALAHDAHPRAVAVLGTGHPLTQGLERATHAPESLSGWDFEPQPI